MRLRAGRSIERMTNYGNQFLYAGSAISKHGTGEAQRGLRAEKAKTAFSPPATGRSAGGSAHSAGIGPEVQDGDSASGLRPALFGHIKETGAGTAFSAIRVVKAGTSHRKTEAPHLLSVPVEMTGR
ncbi:hypothetical protein ASD31_02205 [Rhizobium sp. Root482]|nr:hypothetical protein ASD31_02205 [Rhizobium sp. Root482]